MVSFEIFVKAMPPTLSELKVLPSFCFAFKIPDDVAASNVDSYAKTFLILYPSLENSTTPIAIAYIYEFNVHVCKQLYAYLIAMLCIRVPTFFFASYKPSLDQKTLNVCKSWNNVYTKLLYISRTVECRFLFHKNALKSR